MHTNEQVFHPSVLSPDPLTVCSITFLMCLVSVSSLRVSCCEEKRWEGAAHWISSSVIPLLPRNLCDMPAVGGFNLRQEPAASSPRLIGSVPVPVIVFHPK